jgi:hypothetical protein
MAYNGIIQYEWNINGPWDVIEIDWEHGITDSPWNNTIVRENDDSMEALQD